MQDEYVQAGSVTREKAQTFRTINTGYRPHEFNDLVHMGVIFEMDLDATTVDRVVYSVVDWLSDLGGLSSTLISIFTGLFFLLKYNNLDFYMVSKLYSRN